MSMDTDTQIVRVIDDTQSLGSQGVFINHRQLEQSDSSGSMMNGQGILMRNNRPTYDGATSDGGSVIQYMGHADSGSDEDVRRINFEVGSVGGDSQLGGIKPRALVNHNAGGDEIQRKRPDSGNYYLSPGSQDEDELDSFRNGSSFHKRSGRRQSGEQV